MSVEANDCMRGVILDSDSFDRGDLDTAALDNALDHWTHHRSTMPDEVPKRLEGYEVVVTNKLVINTTHAIHFTYKYPQWERPDFIIRLLRSNTKCFQ